MAAYIVAIDQSTSASKAFLLDEAGQVVRSASLAHGQHYPQPGYVEHDAQEIFRNVEAVLAEVTEGVTPAALALCNQRETTVIWDRETGEPLCPAIVWQDVRAAAWCAERMAMNESVRGKTGISLSPYYSAAKAAFALAAHPEWRARACVGTVDSFLIYRLTGGQVFKTDVSNASRTQLMNLDTLSWDEELCGFFGIPMDCLPEIVPSDAQFGETAQGIPIIGVMGDSHAALFGQGCLRQGMAKATYGTGSSVMLNIGHTPVPPPDGLCTSVGFGFAGETCYVLEGNVISCGDTLQWLISELGLFENVEEITRLAGTVTDTQGVTLVPAFSGLGAPYQREDARALLCGMSRSTNRAHIARAALASIALQDVAVIRAMGESLSELRVDGGPTKNALLMQMQADLLGSPVQCTAQSELSAIGVGLMAGLTLGIYKEHIHVPAARYQPATTPVARDTAFAQWQHAISKAIH